MKSLLRDNFCSSPWFHIRIDPAGNYLPCRWGDQWEALANPTQCNINNTILSEYMNSDQMSQLRLQLLNGEVPKICKSCKYEEQHNKVNGRQRQLLKSAINLNTFEKSICASPHYTLFEHSLNNQGHTDYLPTDLQIDLGTTCNGACIMCSPKYSSKLAADYVKLNQIDPRLFVEVPSVKNWTDDPVLIERFINDISEIKNLKYIHFIGGETLYLKSFYTICNKLIELDLAKNISMGTTTNCSIYSDELEYIIKKFNHVHIGLSVECIHKLNDYVRWPAEIDTVVSNLEKFIALREQTGIHLSLRITPNVFTVFHLDTIFEFMIKHQITAESCDILREPTCLKIELLPKELAEIILTKINTIISKYQLIKSDQVIINRRSDSLVSPVISDVIFEYQRLLETYQAPTNVEEERHNLVKFVKAFESLRNNTILSYLPEYEEFLRSYGY
jgi:hypothetical protein